MPKTSLRTILFNQAIFLATGCVTTLGTQWLRYRGAADSKSLLTVLCSYLGMICIVLLPDKEAQKAKLYAKKSIEPEKGVTSLEKEFLGPQVNHTGYDCLANEKEQPWWQY